MTGIAVILHSVKPRNNVKYPGISDTFHVKMMALKQLNDSGVCVCILLMCNFVSDM